MGWRHSLIQVMERLIITQWGIDSRGSHLQETVEPVPTDIFIYGG